MKAEIPDNSKANQIQDKNKDIPEAMNPTNIPIIIQNFRKDNQLSNQNAELTLYRTMEGMQNDDKLKYFNELVNFDDVLRMNTVEAFIDVSLLCIRKTSKANLDKITALNNTVYKQHAKTHKTNMVSKGREREKSYVKILSKDNQEVIVPTGIHKLFGIGRHPR